MDLTLMWPLEHKNVEENKKRLMKVMLVFRGGPLRTMPRNARPNLSRSPTKYLRSGCFRPSNPTMTSICRSPKLPLLEKRSSDSINLSYCPLLLRQTLSLFFPRGVLLVGETVTTQPLRGNNTCRIQLTSVEDWQSGNTQYVSVISEFWRSS